MKKPYAACLTILIAFVNLPAHADMLVWEYKKLLTSDPTHVLDVYLKGYIVALEQANLELWHENRRQLFCEPPAGGGFEVSHLRLMLTIEFATGKFSNDAAIGPILMKAIKENFPCKPAAG
jgi:hypothetical protein